MEEEINTLLKNYYKIKKTIIFTKNAFILPFDESKDIGKIFPLNISSKLHKIFNKKYRVEYFTLDEEYIGFVVYRNDNLIYYEAMYYMFQGMRINKIYNPDLIIKNKGFIKPLGGSKTKNFLFDLKNFWWKLTLEKAKTLIIK